MKISLISMSFSCSKILYVFFLLLALFSMPCFALNASLLSPENSQNFSTNNNLTFNCSASGNFVKNLSLYHNITGAFALNNTMHYGEFGDYSETLFLCHFNDELSCYGGNGTPASNSSLSFAGGRFNSGIFVNTSGVLNYSSSGNINKSQGTIEFWFKPSFNIPDGNDHILYTLGSKPTPNVIEIYIHDELLTFMIFDAYETERTVTKDITSWNADEWHHIAVVWDLDSNVSGNSRMEMYVDGSSSSGGINYDISLGSIPSNIYIGSYPGDPANGVIDELRVSNIPRTHTEINQSYQSGINDYSYVSAEWTLYNMPDGNYTWNCMASDNNSQINFSAVNYTFFIDTNPPSITSVSALPFSEDELDPDTLINVSANISDISAIDRAILQWKETGEEWTNTTMSFAEGLWNASFQIDSSGGLYYYRIIVNDTNSHSSYSSACNITAEWDYTWSVNTTSLGTVQGFINSISSVGLFTVNNTGDDTLFFTITHNWPLAVYFNGTESSYQFYLGEKATAIINVTALFAGTSGENNMVMTITASHGTETPVPVSRTVNATLNSYSGGPYPDVTITSYPGSLLQGSEVSLIASIRNIGNETSSLALFSWALPAGWSIISGNLTNNITNLASGSSEYFNINVSISSSSAATGLATLVANASMGNYSVSDSVNILVNCSSSDGVCGLGCSHVNDADCSGVTLIGGGSGSTTISTKVAVKFDIIADTVDRLDIERGQSKSFLVNVSNPEPGTYLYNTTLSIEGYPLAHMKISPLMIKKMSYNETRQFNVEIIVPFYMKHTEISLILYLEANASDGDINETVVKRMETSLLIHETVENETVEYLASAELSVLEMISSGFNTSLVSHMLEKAKTAFNGGDFDTAKVLSKDIISIKAASFSASGFIRIVEAKLKEAEYMGISAYETRKLYDLAMAAFSREDYARAEDRAKNAITAYAVEGRDINLAKFIYNNWLVILIVSVLSGVIILFSYRKVMLITLGSRLKMLKKEAVLISSLMKDVQKRHFKEGSITSTEYHKSIYEYEKRLADIEKNKTRLISKMAGITRPADIITGFQKEIRLIDELIMDNQKKYFVDGSISKSAYEKNIDTLEKEKIEIQKSIEIARHNISRQKKRPSKKIALILVLSVMFTPVYAATMESALLAIETAEKDMADMQEAGFGIAYANDTIREARLLLSRGNYLGAEKTAEYVGTIKATAVRLSSMIDETETRLYEASKKGIDTSSARVLFDEGLAAMEVEDYVGSGEYITQAYNKLDELESEAAVSSATEKYRLDLVALIKEHWLFILIYLSAGSLIGFFAYKRTGIFLINKKIRKLELEEESIKKLLEDAQKSYFELNEIGVSEYKIAIDRYNERLAQIKEELPLLSDKLIKSRKFF